MCTVLTTPAPFPHYLRREEEAPLVSRVPLVAREVLDPLAQVETLATGADLVSMAGLDPQDTQDQRVSLANQESRESREHQASLDIQ